MTRFASTARQHLDARLGKFRGAGKEPRPPKGWIRAIRDALGMSTAELADRLHVAQSRIVAIERAEATGGIQLRTLEHAAEAMGCRVVYALVPDSSLDEMVREQAQRKATSQLSGVAHTMRLEDQTVDQASIARQIDELAAELMDRRGLWKE